MAEVLDSTQVLDLMDTLLFQRKIIFAYEEIHSSAAEFLMEKLQTDLMNIVFCMKCQSLFGKNMQPYVFERYQPLKTAGNQTDCLQAAGFFLRCKTVADK